MRDGQKITFRGEGDQEVRIYFLGRGGEGSWTCDPLDPCGPSVRHQILSKFSPLSVVLCH